MLLGVRNSMCKLGMREHKLTSAAEVWLEKPLERRGQAWLPWGGGLWAGHHERWLGPLTPRACQVLTKVRLVPVRI